MSCSREKLIKFYLSYDKRVNNEYINSIYRKKYDYTSSEVLADLRKLVDLRFPYYDEYEIRDVKGTFVDYLVRVLDKFKDDRVYNNFVNVAHNTNVITLPNLDYDESRAFIQADKKGNISLNIALPDADDSSLLHAIKMHELGHLFIFSCNPNRKVDLYEYSEVPSMFLEYLMYSSVDPENGLDDFITNRTVSINDALVDLDDDLFYAENPNLLMIPERIYGTRLSSSISMIEGIDYTLNLIEREKELKGCATDAISRVLLGESTCEEEARKLDIDTSKLKKVKKLTIN